MQCERCGVEMNRHAEKPDWSAEPGSEGFDPALGCAVEEIHMCPQCGETVSRRVSE